MQHLIDSSLQVYYKPRNMRSIKRLRIMTMTDGLLVLTIRHLKKLH